MEKRRDYEQTCKEVLGIVKAELRKFNESGVLESNDLSLEIVDFFRVDDVQVKSAIGIACIALIQFAADMRASAAEGDEEQARLSYTKVGAMCSVIAEAICEDWEYLAFKLTEKDTETRKAC